VIFGLTISTFLTLVIVPTFYSLLESWTTRLSTFVGRFIKKDEDEEFSGQEVLNK